MSQIEHSQIEGSIEKIIKSNKQEFITTIPTSHEVIHRSILGLIRKKAQHYDMLMSQITSKNYKETEIGGAILVFRASLIPSSGYAGFATTLPFEIASIFENSGIPCDMASLVNSLPNRDMIRKCVTENEIGTVLLTQESVALSRHVYISCNKGNKKGKKILQSLFAGLIVRQMI